MDLQTGAEQGRDPNFQPRQYTRAIQTEAEPTAIPTAFQDVKWGIED